MNKKTSIIPLSLLLLLGFYTTPAFSSPNEAVGLSVTFSYTSDITDFTFSSGDSGSGGADTGVVSGHTPGEANVVVPTQDASGNIVTEIGNGVFNNDDYMETLEIPATVTTLGWLNLMGCDNLETITLYAEDPITTWTSIFGLQLSRTVKIYVPDAAYNTYRNASG